LAMCRYWLNQGTRNVSDMDIIFAVHKERCACIEKDIEPFEKVDDRLCTIWCMSYQNPICGGLPDAGQPYWGVFREYDFQALTGQGAYDPWRYLWFTIVIVKEIHITGGWTVPDGVQPERYFLHCASVIDGLARFEYQRKLPGIVHGLQYDIDSSRLVGLFTSASVGRLRKDMDWEYKLAVIEVNTTITSRPRMFLNLAPIAIEADQSDVYLAINGASAIIGVGNVDCFIFTQADASEEKRHMKDRVYIVRIPDGYVVHHSGLAMKVLQLFANEKYGDISAIGPMMQLSTTAGAQTYVKLGRVYRSDVELRTLVEWTYTPNNIELLVDDFNSISDLLLYPGVSSTEHLFNKSALMYRHKNPLTESLGVATVLEVDIRTKSTRLWCGEPCQGTLDPEVPYASIFNPEPGIPLSLKSPKLSMARFTIEAGTLIVEFDRPTLKGAKQVDLNNDMVPDYIDRSEDPQGEFDCAMVFADNTMLLLGSPPDTMCLWKSDSVVQVNLPRIINISVGDSLFVRQDTIYTVPRDGEWSPASSSSVQVFAPDPLEPPVIILTGSLFIDECSPVLMDASDSFNTGGLPSYQWSLLPTTDEIPNPKDLTNNPFRDFDPVLIAGIIEKLDEFTDANAAQVEMPSNLLEPAATYRMKLSITSRWQLTTDKVVLLTKLSFAAPMVSILGSTMIWRNRTERVSLQASGSPSKCLNAETRLGYRWTVSSGNFDFKEHPNIPTETSTLEIPAFILEPAQDGSEYNEYNFTVECFVDTEIGDTPERTASASVTVRVRRSPVYVVFRTESRRHTRGDILVLDARGTQDPDYPTPEGQTFKGTYDWSCFTPDRRPCFSGSTTGVIQEPLTCRQDIGTKIQDGGQTFYAPLFDDLEYCQYARGVMMFQTQEFVIGEYKFSVEATAYDGRSASQDVFIDITNVRVPKIVLNVHDRQEKYPVTRAIRIIGTQEGPRTNESYNYTWQVLMYLLNPNFQQELADEMVNDPDNPYVVDKYTYIDRSSLYNTRDQASFQSSPSSPNLKIFPGVLQASSHYKFRLNINLPTTTGYSDITILTAGLAPRSGTVDVTPINATTDTPRVIMANHWKADDIPLAYSFGYFSSLAEGGDLVRNFFAQKLPVSSHEQQTLPLGEISTNYTLTIFVQIYTKFDAMTEQSITVQSRPPENLTAAVNDGLAAADSADPAEMMGILNNLLTLAPDDPIVGDEVLKFMTDKMDDVPVTAQQIMTQVSILAKLLDNGNDGMEVMNAVERLSQIAADSESLTVDPNGEGGSIGSTLFHILGGLLPGEDEAGGVDGDGVGGVDSDDSGSFGFGSSNVMMKYRTPNPDFTFTDFSMGSHVDGMMLEASMGRQPVNHPLPVRDCNVLTVCRTAFCDLPGLMCIPRDRAAVGFVCCDARNPRSVCNDPPCWFDGTKCPVAGPRAGLRPERRLQHLGGDRGALSKPLPGRDRRRSRQAQGLASPEQQLAQTRHNWFDQWSVYNFPLRPVDETAASDWDRATAYHGWHPDPYKRKLLYAQVDSTAAPVGRFLALEMDERIMLDLAREQVSNFEQEEVARMRADAKQEITFDAMTPEVGKMMRQTTQQKRKEAVAWKLEYDRNQSQRITRIAVMRDTIAKALITQLVSNENPLRFPSKSFTLWIGKTTNLSAVHSAFVFPSQFQVPPDSPDEPTPDNPNTGFAFIYIEYKKNVYDWSDSNPTSPMNQLMTLIALKANTMDIEVRKTEEPIRVFADLTLFSNVACLYWDRFAVDTAGGAWSSKGIVNDGTGCITTHLSDIGIFIDGRVHSGSKLVEAATDWDREIRESTCIGCGKSINLYVIAMLGMVMLVDLLLILLGYVMDESRRSDLARNGNRSRYYYDGDGLTGPLSVDDPIAYRHNMRLPFLWLFTFGNVIMREHAVLSVIFYHETYTRPQRLLCFGALATGLMALNSMIHSHPGYLQKQDQWLISGILSGLLVFPVFCGLVLMFNIRPAAVKKRLIRRTYNPREIDLIQEQRKKLDDTSSLLPPPGYLKLPPFPAGGTPFAPGGTSLLGLPSPLPLPPMLGGVAAGAGGQLALPPPPMHGSGPITGIPALPALPGMGPQTNMAALPPPPKYPPPPKGAFAPTPAMMLPPITFPRQGPPPLPHHGMDASIGGTGFSLMAALDNRPSGDTGATPLQLPPLADGRVTPPPLGVPGPLALRGAASEVEMPPPPPGSIQSEAYHSMAPPEREGMSPPPTPPPATSGPPISFTPPGGGTPTHGKGPPGAGVGPLVGIDRTTPTSSNPHSHRRNEGTLTPPGFPMVPQGAQPMPLFIRGQPYADLPAPFSSAPPGPSGLGVLEMPGQGPPGLAPKGGTPKPPGLAPPPPPPKEDDQAFVRRIRLTYLDKVIREHEKRDLLEDLDDLGNETPSWVFSAMTLLPYLACCSFTTSSIFVVLSHGGNFLDGGWQERYWIKGSLVGLAMVLVLLEGVRIVMMTLVELRKFENRKKSKQGHFLPRRVNKDNDTSYQEAPRPRLWKKAVAAPSVPQGKAEPKRPAFLPKMPGGPPGRPPFRPPGLPAGSSLPVGAPPPPKHFAGAWGPPPEGFEPIRPGFDRSPGPGTPRSHGARTPPTGGQMTPPGGFTPDNTLGQSASGLGQVQPPPLPRGMMGGLPTEPRGVSGLSPQRVDMPPPLAVGSGGGGTTPPTGVPPSPTQSTHSLRSLSQSLSQQVKAGRRPTPPPPPTPPGGSAAAAGTSPGAAPKAPSAPPPGYHRPPSRPTSAGSASAKQMPKPR